MKKTDQELLALAIHIAVNAHHGQYDKGGSPYILHPLYVMGQMRKYNDLELEMIAVLHDVVEDTKVTFQDLVAAGFSTRVIEGVDAVTKRKGETILESAVRTKTNEAGRLVKMEDIKHNSQLDRMKYVEITHKDINRTVKYQLTYMFLSSKIGYHMFEDGITKLVLDKTPEKDTDIGPTPSEEEVFVIFDSDEVKEAVQEVEEILNEVKNDLQETLTETLGSVKMKLKDHAVKSFVDSIFNDSKKEK